MSQYDDISFFPRTVAMKSRLAFFTFRKGCLRLTTALTLADVCCKKSCPLLLGIETFVFLRIKMLDFLSTMQELKFDYTKPGCACGYHTS